MRRLAKRFDRLPVRWRLAVTSAGLTFVILLLFAVIVEAVTVDRMRSDFDRDLRFTATQLPNHLPPEYNSGGYLSFNRQIVEAAATGGSVIRILDGYGAQLMVAPKVVDFGPPRGGVHEVAGYRVTTVSLSADGQVIAYIEYGKPQSDLDHTIGRVRFFLFFGVLGGTALALLAGLAVARRAMSPIARLTTAAQEIARTRDPGLSLPKPEADDEVADLARTLSQMLVALDDSQDETEAALNRQREFVADASHELRTPLTSILTNLELLEAGLAGEDREIAASALRSSHRMRRLVADLLLLARADAGRQSRREPVDLGAVVREAVGELTPTAADHVLVLDAGEPGLDVDGVPDDLHRLSLNLIGNAVSHTPRGTSVRASVHREEDSVVLTVEDDGPGIPPELGDRIFERFVRGAGDTGASVGGGSGLGLAIVRAVAEGHGGSVDVETPLTGGARFVVRLPAGEASAQPAPLLHELTVDS
jgi:two-component system, OmpR family, sensor kinase